MAPMNRTVLELSHICINIVQLCMQIVGYKIDKLPTCVKYGMDCTNTCMIGRRCTISAVAVAVTVVLSPSSLIGSFRGTVVSFNGRGDVGGGTSSTGTTVCTINIE